MIITIQHEGRGVAVAILQYRKCRVYLDRNNTKASRCKDCEKALQVGEGVFRNTFMGVGYICWNCLRADCLARTRDFGFPEADAGFHFSKDYGTLSQCFTGYPPRQFTSLQVLEMIRAEWKYEIAERTLGPEPSPQRVSDASESIPF